MKGWLAAVAYIGTTVGLIVFGDLADRFGRKIIFVINLLFFVLASLGSAFVTELWQLVLARFLIGIAVGMDIPTSQSFLAEIAPSERRGRVAGSLPNMMWLSGAIASVLIAIAIKPFAGAETWRWLFGISALPAFAVLVARQRLPESPRWLIAQGRVDEARAILRMLDLPMPSVAKPVARHYRALFRGDGSRRLVTVSAFFALQGFGIAIATIAAPIVFATLGFPVHYSLLFSLGGYVMGLVAVFAGSLVIDIWSRRKLGIVTCLGAFVCGVGMATIGHASSFTLFICFVVYSFAAWSGPGVLCWVWSSEVFPTEVRGLGSGIAQCATRIAVALNVVLAPTLIANLGLKAIAIYAFPYALCALLVMASPFLESTRAELEETSSIPLPPLS